jgi:hypothetical protein
MVSNIAVALAVYETAWSIHWLCLHAYIPSRICRREALYGEQAPSYRLCSFIRMTPKVQTIGLTQLSRREEPLGVRTEI